MQYRKAQQALFITEKIPHHDRNSNLPQPDRSTDASRSGCPAWLTLLEFGTGWCGHCRAAQPALAEALAPHARLRHIKVEDGPGHALGRSFRVKLWPTLVLLRDGQEIARVVRPTQAADLSAVLNEAA